jgi:uncharacterized protein (DUF58 family)
MNSEASAPTPRFHWRPRALLLYGAGALFALTALLLRSPVPLFLAVPLLLAPVAAGLYLPAEGARARIAWEERGAGPEVTVRGFLEVPPDVQPEALSARFVRPEPLEEVRPVSFRFAAHRQRFRLSWRAPYPCIAEVTPPEVTWRDPLGLVEATLPVTGSPLPIERFPPEIRRIHRLQVERTTPLPGEVRSRAVGGAGEFFAIRPFVNGDTSRQINWRATARAGRLLANDYQLERTGDLLIVLDLRPTALGPERDRTLLSVMRAAAVGLTRAFLDQKNRVGLALYGEFLTAIPLGSGRRQRERILRTLRSASIAAEGGPEERLAVSLRRYFSPGVLTLLLSPLATEDSLALLPHLRRRGYSTVVLSPSTIPLLTPAGAKLAPADRLAIRLLRLVRRRQIGQIWRESPAIDWEDFWSLSPLVQLLRRPAHVRRGL